MKGSFMDCLENMVIMFGKEYILLVFALIACILLSAMPKIAESIAHLIEYVFGAVLSLVVFIISHLLIIVFRKYASALEVEASTFASIANAALPQGKRKSENEQKGEVIDKSSQKCNVNSSFAHKIHEWVKRSISFLE